MGTPGHVGFIYVIRDNYMQHLYLGKKLFNEGWHNYRSSSKLLKKLLAARPIDEFSFICLEQYRTRGTLSYAETWTLCHVEAPTSNVWYNKRIEKVSWNVKEPISDRHKSRLAMVVDFDREIQ
jgi:hypothetical protein